ncbi:hypothetical protein KY285_023740 [Solanum tuberosum]|nr:hypothetical protein KY289_024074 [Solanum tuberosum]KAH0675939.1 hypothetical protein KY285_023740 [Solanum tuberosum]
MNSSKGTSRKDQDTARNVSLPDPAARSNAQLSVIHTSGAPTIHEEANQIQEMSMNIQQANVQNKKNHTAESSLAEAQSLNFTFEIRGHKSGQETGESRTESAAKEWTNKSKLPNLRYGGADRTQRQRVAKESE